MILMPVFAKEILHGGSHTFGFLMGAVGLGALLGALYLASRKNALGLGRSFPWLRAFLVWTYCIFLIPVLFAFVSFYDNYRAWYDAGDGIEQHSFTDHRG